MPGRVNGPFPATASSVPKSPSTRPVPWSPSTVPPIVKLGGCTGGVSSSAIATSALRCRPSFAQRARESETRNVCSPSASRSSRIGISTSRGEASPRWKVTVVRVRSKSLPARADPALVAIVALAFPRFPPVRLTSTSIGTPVDSSVA